MPSSWDYYRPTFWDLAALAGSFGLFLTLFCVFVRFLPMVAIAEVKSVLPRADPHYGEPARVVEHGGKPAGGGVR